MNMAEGDTLISVDYEVFGKVQGVFFRKYTQVCGPRAWGLAPGRGGRVPAKGKGGGRSWLLGSRRQRGFAEQWV